MNKQVILEILKRSALLAALLFGGSMATLLTMNAGWLNVVVGSILTPVAGVVVKVGVLYFKNGRKLTVSEVDATFNAAEPPQ